MIRKLDKLYGNEGQYFDAVETEAFDQANIRQRSGLASGLGSGPVVSNPGAGALTRP